MIFDGAKRSGVEGSAVVLAFALAFAFAHLPQICHPERSAAGAPSDRSSSLGWLSGAEGPAFVFCGCSCLCLCIRSPPQNCLPERSRGICGCSCICSLRSELSTDASCPVFGLLFGARAGNHRLHPPK